MKKKSMIELQRISCEEFKAASKLPLVVVLDDVRSMNNIGSVFRTADAFVVEKIALCGITATPPHTEIHKTALGAEESVDWVHYDDVCRAIVDLRGQGYTICAIEQVQGSISLPDFNIEEGKRYAIILGNEVRGVKQEAVDQSDCCIEIPQCGTKHSLNVAVTAGLVMWEFFRHSGIYLK